jgi:hypothetical protein
MYASVIGSMERAYAKCDELGIAEDIFPKGGIGEFLLARHLNHVLVAGGKGADAMDPRTGATFEYKVSAGSGFNFHFGARKSHKENEALLSKKFANISGAYIGLHNRGQFVHVAYCPTDALIEDLLCSVRDTLGGQLQKGYTFQQFLKIGSAVECLPDPEHPYGPAADHFLDVYREAALIGLGAKTFSKGGQSEIVLANALGHTISAGGAGADAIDQSGGCHEYKVSVTNQFNFHLGARKSAVLNRSLIERKVNHLAGVWVARRQGMAIVDHAHCSGAEMGRYLSDHFARTVGGQLNKNFSMDEFKRAFP